MPEIQHLIVLMLENRSFDHMLGFLKHPDSSYRGLVGNESNRWAPGAPPVRVSATAMPTTRVDPGHHHYNILRQLTGLPDLHKNPVINNSGFAWDYGLVSVDHGSSASHGAEIMRCHLPRNVPVLSTLASEFAVSDHWFCSVPGATWPNRNFAVAATSAGQVNIKLKPYGDQTIFELLEDNGREWRIYHDGIPQLLAFPKLWLRIRRRWFKSVSRLFDAIAEDELPHFAFVEPDHFGKDSNSQHPTNNESSARDFLAAEALIREIYEALRAKPEVFEKTLFVITYDEHGGFYDHEPPPADRRFKDGRRYSNGSYTFEFDLLGPRVPTVLVSPWIPQGTILRDNFDHSAIVATARALFAPGAAPLTDRDAASATFQGVCSLSSPRSPAEMPALSPPVLPESTAEAAAHLETLPATHLDEFQRSLLWIAQHVEQALREERLSGMTAEVAHGGLWWDSTLPLRPDIDTVKKADTYQDYVVAQFRQSAE